MHWANSWTNERSRRNRRGVSQLWLGVACLVWLTATGCSHKELEPTPAEVDRPVMARPPAPVFEAVPGNPALRQTTLMKHALPAVNSHLEIRTVLVEAGKPVQLNVEHDGVLELRTGSLTLVTDGKPTPVARGQIWQISKGAKLVLEAKGEVAVVRAIYLIPGAK